MAGLFVQKHKEAVEAVCHQEGKDIEIRVNTFWPSCDLIQLNVLTLKWGMLALLMHGLLGTPYIIVEHWSGYLPANGTVDRMPWCKRYLMRLIARHAEAIYPVSRMLEENMRRCGIVAKQWGRMENVVDGFFYEEGKESREGKERLLHVSCYDEAAKNVKGLLRAARRLAEKRQDWTLTLVGTGTDWQMCRDYADSLHFPKGMLLWTGELTPRQVCEQMQTADAFVLFSRYENAPVVLSESMAVGLPVISSRAGGIPEMIDDECGILVDVEDEQALCDAMDNYLQHHVTFNPEHIRRHGQKYSYDVVGRKLLNIYEQYRRS